MRTQKKGFTLIELLVVIAIIGLLASVVLASLDSARTKSRDAKRLSDAKQMQLALELFFDEEGTYVITTGGGKAGGGLDDYLSPAPTDPSTGSKYDYEDSDSTNGTGICSGSLDCYAIQLELEGTAGTCIVTDGTYIGGAFTGVPLCSSVL